MLKLYVAGASTEAERAGAFMGAVEAEPTLELTFNWLAHIEAAGSANDVPRAVARSSAKLDIAAVEACDVFVLLVPAAWTRGAWVELGVALKAGKRVVASGCSRDVRSIFLALADQTFYLDDRVTQGGARPALDETQRECDRSALAWLLQYDPDERLHRFRQFNEAQPVLPDETEGA